MELIPRKIYENFICEKISKNETVNLLLTLIENADDDVIRNDCIDTLNKLDFINLKVFKILEDILISEQNQRLRYSAAQVLREKFINKCLDPFLWTLQHETSYDVLVTVIKSLKETGDNRIASALIDKLTLISDHEMWKDTFPSFTQNLVEKPSLEYLVEILINLVTLNYLKKKFQNLLFKIENGFLIEIDFSKVDNFTINWRDKDTFQYHSEIFGIENLRKLEKINFFNVNWTTNNEYNYKSSIALIKVLERLNNKVAKDALISQIKLIDDNEFNSSIKHLYKQFEKLSISKLSEIFRNYLTFSYMRTKYQTFNYKILEGELVSIQIQNIPLIKIPFYIKYFRSLKSLILKNCSIYKLCKSIGLLKHLNILDMEGNKLKIISKSISSLGSLKLLNLSNNQLEKIPYSIGKLSSLQYLSLKRNNLVIL
ncbi:MAG: hypothetical protein ACFFE5_14645, partial [Candidatus Thorarchaeota archaeon]